MRNGKKRKIGDGMSNIIVRGMDKPESCVKCFFRDGIFCKAKNYKRISYVALDGKIEIWCPLVEIKTPHGRMIDADALNTYNVSPIYEFCVMGITEEDIGLAETIIEAEGRET